MLVDRSYTDFDGLKGNVVFCSWTDSNPMTPQRAECLLSIYANTMCPVMFLSASNLKHWEVEQSPFHEGFRYLSATQRADYVRCYVMHHFGGGHTDVKRTATSWKPFFQALRESPHYYGLGYTEIGPNGVACAGGPLESEMRENYTKLIGNCAYIFRKKTEFTYEWLLRTHAMMDEHLEALREHPAQHPMDHLNVTLPDGSVSRYPLPWLAFCNIFHAVVYELHSCILHADIAPQFYAYR